MLERGLWFTVDVAFVSGGRSCMRTRSPAFPGGGGGGSQLGWPLSVQAVSQWICICHWMCGSGEDSRMAFSSQPLSTLPGLLSLPATQGKGEMGVGASSWAWLCHYHWGCTCYSQPLVEQRFHDHTKNCQLCPWKHRVHRNHCSSKIFSKLFLL